jgi:hypothetical protein
MSVINFTGAFYTKLFSLFKAQDGLTIGEKLALLEVATKKGFRKATDKEMYEALDLLLTEDLTDEPLTDEEFQEWADKH